MSNFRLILGLLTPASNRISVKFFFNSVTGSNESASQTAQLIYLKKTVPNKTQKNNPTKYSDRKKDF